MGELNVKIASGRKSVNNFTKSLLRDIQALERMIAEEWFECEDMKVGVEQELCLVDAHYKPAPLSMEVLEKLGDPFTTELAKFNIEANLDPILFTGSCFSSMEANILELLEKLQKVLTPFEVNYILSGILPTIRKFDLELNNVTPLERYHALIKAIEKLRGKIYELRIRGIDELNIKHDSAMLEACNTSFQVHLQIRPENFVHKYNLAQVLTAPVMAIACNSPMLFGKRLWKETRVALFQQSIDTRITSEHLRDRSPRVTFGHSWLKGSVSEIFKEDIVRFRVMLMTRAEKDVIKQLEDGITPKLKALSIHNSTVYRWNRPCYGVSPSGKPHLRIENRALPSGPSVIDEVANAAFWTGLMNGLDEQYPDVTRKIEFDDAKANFIACARQGLDCELTWMNGIKISVSELIKKELLPVAREGLAKNGVNKKDIDKYLGVIEARNESRNTGAVWILKSFSQLAKEANREEISVAITSAMLARQHTGDPAHKWPLASMQDIMDWKPDSLLVEEFMTTDLFTVLRTDIPELVADIMDWQRIRYTPVEDEKGRLVGLISSRILLRYFSHITKNGEPGNKTVEDLMIPLPITISPEANIFEAMKMMRSHKIGCLPVVKNEKLVGIITEGNFLNITGTLLNIISKKGKR